MPYLRDFDLTLPSGENKQKFVLATRCMTSLYARLITKKVKTESCWKILVECVETVTKEKYRDLLGVYTIQIQTDVESFFSMDDEQKKKHTVSVLMQGIRTVAKQAIWDIYPFELTYQSIKELNYINRWIWSKGKISPSRKHSVEVLCEHDVKSCLISLVIRDRDGTEVKRKLIISEKPDEFAFARHLGRLRWLSENKAELNNQKSDQSWEIRI